MADPDFILLYHEELIKRHVPAVLEVMREINPDNELIPLEPAIYDTATFDAFGAAIDRYFEQRRLARESRHRWSVDEREDHTRSNAH
jgi:hypothetical protein